MENSKGSGMRINWVVADHTVLPPDVEVAALKDIAAIWGSWRTWRGCGTDNVICNDAAQARDLIKRRMNEQCNLYIPNAVYNQLDRPGTVRLYEGQFTFDIDNPDELIGIQLVSGQSDIVLLMGFDWAEKPVIADRLLAHRAANYRRFVRDTIAANPSVQWVLVDHVGPVGPDLAQLENLTQDSLGSVTDLLRPQ